MDLRLQAVARPRPDHGAGSRIPSRRADVDGGAVQAARGRGHRRARPARLCLLCPGTAHVEPAHRGRCAPLGPGDHGGGRQGHQVPPRFAYPAGSGDGRGEDAGYQDHHAPCPDREPPGQRARHLGLGPRVHGTLVVRPAGSAVREPAHPALPHPPQLRERGAPLPGRGAHPVAGGAPGLGPLERGDGYLGGARFHHLPHLRREGSHPRRHGCGAARVARHLHHALAVEVLHDQPQEPRFLLLRLDDRG